MNKILYSIILTALLVIGITAACTAGSQTTSETPMPTASSTETQTPMSMPTAPVQTATPQFAPFCESDNVVVSTPSQCQAPVAEEGSTYCSDKKPYNLILINQGSTYEALTKGFTCSDAGKKNDKELVACTGPMAMSFTVRVCDPACAIPTAQAEVTACPQDYNYNDLQGCCSKGFQQIDQNCSVLELRTTSCVVNCGEVLREYRCKKNSFACEWNADAEVCQQRK